MRWHKCVRMMTLIICCMCAFQIWLRVAPDAWQLSSITSRHNLAKSNVNKPAYVYNSNRPRPQSLVSELEPVGETPDHNPNIHVGDSQEHDRDHEHDHDHTFIDSGDFQMDASSSSTPQQRPRPDHMLNLKLAFERLISEPDIESAASQLSPSLMGASSGTAQNLVLDAHSDITQAAQTAHRDVDLFESQPLVVAPPRRFDSGDELDSSVEPAPPIPMTTGTDTGDASSLETNAKPSVLPTVTSVTSPSDSNSSTQASRTLPDAIIEPKTLTCPITLSDAIRKIAKESFVYGLPIYSVETCDEDDRPTLLQTDRVSKACSWYPRQVCEMSPPGAVTPQSSRRIFRILRSSVIEQEIKLNGPPLLLVIRSIVLTIDSVGSQLVFVAYVETIGEPRLEQNRFQGLLASLLNSMQFRVKSSLLQSPAECTRRIHPQRHFLHYDCAMPSLLTALEGKERVEVTLFDYLTNREYPIALHAIPAHKPKFDVIQCIRPLFGNPTSLRERLPEFIAASLVMGIQHFVFYARTIEDVDKSLMPFILEGIISVVIWPEWNSPGFALSVGRSFDQSLAMMDCTLRNIDVSRILHADFDEYLSFGPKHQDKTNALGACSTVEATAAKISCILDHNVFSTGKGTHALTFKLISLPRWRHIPDPPSTNPTDPPKLLLEQYHRRHSQMPEVQSKILIVPAHVQFLTPHAAWYRGSSTTDLRQNFLCVRHFRSSMLPHACTLNEHSRGCVFDDSLVPLAALVRQVMDSAELRAALSKPLGLVLN